MKIKIKEKDKRALAAGFATGMAVVLLSLYYFGASTWRSASNSPLDYSFNATHLVITHQGVNQTYGVYLAASAAQQQQGYMNQTTLGDCRGISPCIGMIFLFNRQQQLCFWMQNTRIPLLQAWINNGTVVYIYQAQPYSRQAICYNATSVLETSPSQQLKVGDRVTVLKQ